MREKLLPHADLLINSFGPRNELFERSRANADFAYVEAQGQRANLAPGGLGMRLHEAAAKAAFPKGKAAMLVRAMVQAGLDTTIKAIGATLFCLARFPDQWLKLRKNPELVKAAFDEAIRFESPVQTEFRTATCNTEIDGLQSRAGEKILILLGGANRDPRKWNEPDRYDIDRNVVAIWVSVTAGPPVRHYNNTVRGLGSLP